MKFLASLPEQVKLVVGAANQTTNGGVTADYISMKNVHRAWIIAIFDQAVGHATGIDPVQASAVAGTGAKALTVACPIWANEDVGAASTLTKKTAAVTYNVTNDIKEKIVVIQVDAAGFDHANDFDVLGCTVDDSSQATNFVTILYALDMRYDQSIEVITD